MAIIRLGALLHDIGKIGLADDILQKAEPLSADEYEQIKRHPALGARILRQVSFLEPHLPIVELHHERPDGHGYPFGLRGADVPMAARIVHVADAYDAMTSARAYRPARPPAAAMAELHLYAGTQFDADCVSALHEALRAAPADTRAASTMWQADGMRAIPAAAALGLAALLWAAPAAAQRVAGAVVADARHVGRRGSRRGRQRRHRRPARFSTPYVAARLAPGLEIAARPWTQRQASGEWNRQLWLAAVRYEHKGAVGVRVEGGLITSPVGLANLSLRPHLNPTVAQPSSLFQGLPSPEAFSPRVTLLGAVYPLGVSTTVSGTHWDVRGAVIDTSPLRARRTFGSTNPPRFTNVVVGGGVTPVVGLRIGGSVTRGALAPGRRAAAQPVRSDGHHRDRRGRVVVPLHQADRRVDARHARDQRARRGGVGLVRPGRADADAALVRGRRAWSGSRGRRSLATPQGPRQTFAGAEETVGFRITPEITRARQLPGAAALLAAGLLAPGDGVRGVGATLVLSGVDILVRLPRDLRQLRRFPSALRLA